MPGRDDQLVQDMAAYRRLQSEGHLPRSIDGSAALEAQATSAEQIRTETMVPTAYAEKSRG